MNSKPTLGFWEHHAQPIRLLLHYLHIEYNVKCYSDRKVWSAEKATLGLDFPNLPYYIDGDVKLTHGWPIVKYLGRQRDLVARDEPTIIQQEIVENFLMELRNTVIETIGTKTDYLTDETDYCTGIMEPKLKLLAKFLGDKQWLTGSISYVDFMCYTFIDMMRRYSPQTIAKFPTIAQYLQRFEALPAVNHYMSSTPHKNWPLFASKAK